ncbi:MAG: sensor histidine kinase [Anaerolineales bacterium]
MMNQGSSARTLEASIDRTITQPQLQGIGLQVARAAWVLLALAVLAILITSLPGYVQQVNRGVPGHGPAVPASTGFMALQFVNALASIFAGGLSLALALLLFRQKFENPAVAAVSFYLLLFALFMTGMFEIWGNYWLGNNQFVMTLQALILTTPTIALLALFPNGRFVPAWTRWLLLISIPWNLLTFWLMDFSFSENAPAAFPLLALLWITLPFSGLYAQLYRYRHVSTPQERQQTRWALLGFSLWIGYILLSSIPYFYVTNLPPDAPLPWWEPIIELGWWLSQSILPVTLTIAITRSQLWNIKVVINRTLVYGALSLITIALYIFVVGAASSLFQSIDRSLIAFIATGIIAVLFQPLRDRLQRAVNRLMYGERDDPVAVLTRLGAELEHTGSPEETLNSIVETVAHTLKLPYVAILLGEDPHPAAAHGQVPAKETEEEFRKEHSVERSGVERSGVERSGVERSGVYRLPLSYQAETAGFLEFAPRAPGESLSPSDWQLLENISHQAGAAAYAARLTADLRRSRQQLVTTREEERRRLRRDLHDGLGPTLASLTLKLDAARNQLRRDPDKAEDLLISLKQQTQHTIKDVRTLVYDLRPPALDELGLIGAIRSYLSTQVPGVPVFQLAAPPELPPLPAAYEVAAYRITLEGITNVLRHAEAKTATIRIFIQDGALMIEIQDDGLGIQTGKPAGVGLASIRERAEELGGTFELRLASPGTLLRARLPLPEA